MQDLQKECCNFKHLQLKNKNRYNDGVMCSVILKTQSHWINLYASKLLLMDNSLDYMFYMISTVFIMQQKAQTMLYAKF
jgi:hypothetical protein